MLMDTNMNLQWAPPSVEPIKQPEDWTKGKSKSFSQYDNIVPTGTSEEGIANTKMAQAWGKTLPKLLLAKTDAEFDQLLDKYQKDRKAAGLDKVEAYKQKEFESNNKKIAQFSK
jgi:putative aldouronate transport system substrate-binding protein